MSVLELYCVVYIPSGNVLCVSCRIGNGAAVMVMVVVVVVMVKKIL